MSDETNKRIGDYEILGVLGSGGMGKVFKVRNVITDRTEAMKIVASDLAGRQDVADRFLREIKVLATLDHPNIAALRTALKVDNQLLMIMEYVEGTTLSARLSMGGIPVPDVLNYIDQALTALSYAHKKQVIHRDIKPGNLMLTPQGVVKVMDFGIARSGGDRGMTMTGTTMGSLCYMSPEQVKGQEVDVRSDVYSMGVSLYELVTGERPFRADSDFSLMTAQVEQPPKPPIQIRPDLPPALNEIILTAMAKDPTKRFQSADAFRNALGTVRKGLGEAQTAEMNAVAKTNASTGTAAQRAEGTSTRTLEMAHVLFTDIVAYSQLPMDTQEQVLTQLQGLVRSTVEFSRAQSGGQLISLPTGDGMALVFFGDAEAPARCALELSRALRLQSGIQLRMGIHTGPVYRVADINANRNVAGGGINMAQRVMDCGDAGHILVSGAVADVLGQVSTWRQALHDLGEAEVKHGVRVRIYNLYTDEVGNSSLPHKLEGAQKAQAATATTATLTPPAISIPSMPAATQIPTQTVPSVIQPSPPPGRRGLYMALGALLVLVVLIAAGLYIPRRSKTRASDQVAPMQQEQSAQPMQSGNPTTVATPATTTATPNSASDSTAVPAQTTPEPTPSPRNQVEKKSGAKKVAAIPSATQQQAQPEAQTGGTPAQSNDAAELEELEQTVDQLTSRAAAVNSSLDNLRRQQAAQGFGLRGDISSTEEMMKTHLARAQAALQNQDAKNAKKYADMASSEVEKLEQFLGR
ncbi:MAG TPA: protein kinase [Terriglobales bacterium]|nr:protein kinase [Terriglobales bacterium]